MGPFFVSSRYVPRFPEKSIGPLTARASPVPLQRSREMGPFTALASSGPEQSSREIGPFVVRAVTRPETACTAMGPLLASRSRAASRGALTIRYTIQSPPEGPRNARPAPAGETWIPSSSSARRAALQTVTPNSSRFPPLTKIPEFSGSCTRSGAAVAGRVNESSARAASRESYWMRTSRQVETPRSASIERLTDDSAPAAAAEREKQNRSERESTRHELLLQSFRNCSRYSVASLLFMTDSFSTASCRSSLSFSVFAMSISARALPWTKNAWITSLRSSTSRSLR